MNFPQSGDFIDFHTHGDSTIAGVYIIENLMAHEGRTPGDIPKQVCSFGIHPWYLNYINISQLSDAVHVAIKFPNLIAIGEAGFDKLRGPSNELQLKAFETQVLISEEIKKPVIIHCVRAWDELLAAHKRLKPKMPWLVHGFRGKIELATQLLSKGMYLSFWFDFVMRSESSILMRSLPKERIFLETDGSGVDIRNIYHKVSNDLGITVEELKDQILSNFNNLFKMTVLTTE